MTAQRKRLGLLVPSSNTSMEYEFARYMPRGVTLHTSRMPIAPEVTESSLLAMSAASVDHARLLADCRADVILYGCTSGSFIKGKGFDARIAQDIEQATGIRATSTSHCVLEALSHVGVKKLAVYTPYIEEVNRRAQTFLQDNGFEVTALYGMGLLDNLDIGRVEPGDILKMVLDHDRCSAEAVFISCTNLRTIEIIAPLSRVLGIPVISSNQASLWGALRLLGRGEAFDLTGPYD